MKKLIYIAAIFLIPLLAQNKNNEIKISNKTEILKVKNERTSVASVPRKIAYQGILTKDNGQPADDRMYNVKFRLYNLLEGGEPFWEESQIIFINDGLLSATVGVYNELNKIPANAFLEVEVGGSVLEPRQEMTSVFYSIISDTSYFAKGYTRTEDLPSVSLSGEYSDLKNIPDTLIADVFIGSASGLTGILADSVGVLSGSTPIVFDGETNDNNKISLTVEEPTSNQEIIIPNTSGTLLTTGNDQLIDEVGIIHSGVWMGDEIEDTFIDNDLSILDGEINATPIGNSVPSSANFTSLTTEDGLKIYNGNIALSNDELNVLDSVVHGQASPARALVVDSEKDIHGLRNINAAGTVNAESFAGMFMGDGSGITGVSANSIKSDDLTPGDAAVTISTSTGGINLTPAAGSMIVLDGSVSVDEGIVSGITSLTAGSINTGTVNAESFAGMFIGDGSGITGVSANSIKSDDLTPGDAAVTISTSTGGINLTPAAGSMIVLDGSVSVDEGIVSGITSLTAGTINDGTATLSNGALSGATTITGSGAITGGSLIVDEILINRSEIGHIQNSDLITLSANQVLVDGGVTVGTLNIGGTNITATANELNYVDGVTSNIQTQLDSKTGITTDQASAISANTAKVGYTDDLVAANSAVAANTAKTGITTDQASAITANTAKVGYTDDLVAANSAVAANTAKTGITTSQASAITANTAKVGYTDDLVAANSVVAANTAKTGITTDQASAISANTAKVGYTDDLVAANSAVAANTAKTGITTDQASAISANTAKVGYTDDLVAANSAVAANTAKTGITTDQASAITANTAKVGYTDDLVAANSAVAANTAKTGITTSQASAITANTAKVGYTDDLVAANSVVAANTAKTGITTSQASAITANTAKVGYTDDLVAANSVVAANTAKTGITTDQASAISANTAKVGYTDDLVAANSAVAANTAKTGITTDQASAITANTAKVGYTDDLVAANSAVAANTAKTGITTSQASAITANTAKVGYTDDLVAANSVVAANTAKTGITTDQASAISANTAKVGYTDDLVAANSAVAANTAKTGITTSQASAITANTAKTGITTSQASAITANTAKTGITTDQASLIDAITSTATELNILDGVTSTTAELNYVDGVTSNIQTQLDAKTGITTSQASAITANTAKVGYTDDLVAANSAVAANTAKTGITTDQASLIDAITSTATELNILDGVTATTAELNYVDGVTSNIQTQLDAKTGITTSQASAITANTAKTGITTDQASLIDAITSTATELNILDGVTSTTAELNLLDGVTATTAELNYVDGVTSNIQTQLDAKTGITTSQASAITANTAKTGITTDQASLIDAITSTATELNILDGVTSTTAELNLLDGVTATTAELNVLDGALKETNSIWIGSEPSSTTDAAEYNVAVGTTALGAVTTGDSNTALGYNALTANLAGNRNTAVGTGALKSNTTGITNVAVGSNALESNTTANSNTAVGHASSFKLASGQNNVTLGYEASKNMTSANNNVIVGSEANPSADTGTSNQIVIGYNTTGKGNNTVTIGNGDITTWTSTDDGEVDLGSSSVEFKDLYVDGVAYADAIGFGSTAMTVPTADGSNGQVLITDGNGALSWSSTAGNATRASTLTITDNENTNESNALIFTAGGDVDGGDLGLESDGDATYNPSTGVITATGFSGNLTGTLQTAAQTNVTSLGTLSGLTVSGEASVTTLDIGGTNITSTAAELNVLDGALKENNSIWIGSDPSSTTNNASNSVAVGKTALDAITTGSYNTAMGYDALTNQTTGNNNVAIGYEALRDNSTTSQNVAIGLSALQESNAAGNVAIGANAMRGTTNTAITGGENVAVGSSALKLNIGGSSNTAVGKASLASNTDGNYNVAVGKGSLNDNTEGSSNTTLGYLSANTGTNDITTGSNNTLLGASTAVSAAAGTNQIVIGYNTTGKGNNTVTIGNGDITTWTSTDDGEVDLGSSSVEFKDLYVDGVAYADAIGFGSTAMTVPTADGSNGQVLITDGNGALSWSSTAGNATRASTLTITDNENTNESNALVFTAGGDVDGGDLGLESDGDATYNPSTGVITATGFSGNLTGTLQTAAQTNVTSLGTLSGLTVSGEASVTTLDIGGTNITSTAAELNIMDGNTSASSTTIVDADQIVLNDSGIMKQIAMTDLANYVASSSDLDILTDAKSEGTNFTGSLILGHQTTGTLDAAQYNTGVGLAALDAITAGDNNTAIGNNALSDNTTGSDNIAIGYNALADNTTLGSNIAIGRNALAAQTSGGEFNVAVGSYALDENTFGDKNVALGYVALGKNTEAGDNTGIGAEALKLNTTGTHNTGLGSKAGDALGTGSQNVLIGASTDPSAADATNQTVIGYNSTGQADNSVTLGNADVTAVYMAQDKGATVHAAGISLENDETITNATDGTLILNGEVAAGTGSAAGIFKSNGDYDVTLKTGNSTTGSITITDGANGNVTIAPDGTGKTDFNDSPLTGFGADVQTETGTSKTLAATDNGTIINCSSGSAITITVPTSLPTGFNCMIIQSGSGQVTLSASSTTLNNKNGKKTSGQHAIMTLVHLGSNVFVISGDTSS